MGSAAAAHASRQAESAAAAEQKAKEAAASGTLMGSVAILVIVASPPGVSFFLVVSMAQMANQGLQGTMGDKGREIASMPGTFIINITNYPEWIKKAGGDIKEWGAEKLGAEQSNTAPTPE